MSDKGQILSRSPWEDFGQENEKIENIFTKARKKITLILMISLITWVSTIIQRY